MSDSVERHSLRGFAPGSYTSKCMTCGNEFHYADKRATECFQCASKTNTSDITALEAEVKRLREFIEYVFSTGDVQSKEPRVIDLAFTVFMNATKPNEEDGGPRDWFTDTKPHAVKIIDYLREATKTTVKRNLKWKRV